MLKKFAYALIVGVLFFKSGLAMEESSLSDVSNKRLFIAIENNDKEMMKVALFDGANSNALNEFGDTPLCLTSLKGNLEIAQLLLENGADCNAQTERRLYSPLHYAVKEDNFELAQLLLRWGADPNIRDNMGEPVLHYALKSTFCSLLTHNGDKQKISFKIAKLLLEVGADPNIQNGIKRTVLYWAARQCSSKEVSLLLEYGANPNISDVDLKTPLIEAVSRGDTEMVRMLLEYGADPKAQSKDGEKSIDLAKKEKNSDLITLLLEYGAPANKFAGENNLALAAGQGAHEIVEKLLKDQQNLDQKEINKALCRAAITGHLEIFKMLFACAPIQPKIVRDVFLAIAATGKWKICDFLSQELALVTFLTPEILYKALLRATVGGYINFVRLILELDFEHSEHVSLVIPARRVNTILQNPDITVSDLKQYKEIRSLLVGYQHAKRFEYVLEGSRQEDNFTNFDDSTNFTVRQLPEETRHAIARMAVSDFIKQADIDYSFLRAVSHDYFFQIHKRSTRINDITAEALLKSLSLAILDSNAIMVKLILAKDFEFESRISLDCLDALIELAEKRAKSALKEKKKKAQEIVGILNEHKKLRESILINQEQNEINLNKLPNEIAHQVKKFILGGSHLLPFSA